MNITELKLMMERKRILKTIRDDFNGFAESQNDISRAISGSERNHSVIANLDWLVENGYLTLVRIDGWTKTYTLTEKVT